MSANNNEILYTFDTNQFIDHHLKPIVLSVRKRLTDEYDTSKYKDFSGLCIKSVLLLKEEVLKLNEKYGTDILVKEIHGEQRHNARIDSKYWYVQHSWAIVYGLLLNDTIYVDITSQQFRDLYDDIPEYYISTTPPKWYLEDADNYFFTIYRINKWFAINISKISYHIWGGVCNLYRRLFKIK